MPRDRQIVLGLGVVAVAGLMFDKFVLGPAPAAAAVPSEAVTADSAGPVRSAVAAVGAKVEVHLRDAMMKTLESHVSESLPQMDFGPDAAWLTKAVASVPSTAVPESVPSKPDASASILPGLVGSPTLSLVMPTGDGGLAVISGHRMRVGEIHPSGFRLVGVDARSVTISMNGSSAILSLPSPGN